MIVCQQIQEEIRRSEEMKFIQDTKKFSQDGNLKNTSYKTTQKRFATQPVSVSASAYSTPSTPLVTPDTYPKLTAPILLPSTNSKQSTFRVSTMADMQSGSSDFAYNSSQSKMLCPQQYNNGYNTPMMQNMASNPPTTYYSNVDGAALAPANVTTQPALGINPVYNNDYDTAMRSRMQDMSRDASARTSYKSVNRASRERTLPYQPRSQPINNLTYNDSNIRMRSGMLQDTQPINNRMIQDTQPMNNRMLQDTQPMNNRMMQDTQPMNNRMIQDTQPMNNRMMQDTQPMTNRMMQDTQPITNKMMQDTQPMNNRMMQDTQPMSNRMIQNTQPMSNVAQAIPNQYANGTSWDDMTSQYQSLNYAYNSKRLSVMTPQVDNSGYNTTIVPDVNDNTNRAFRANIVDNLPYQPPINPSAQSAMLNSQVQNSDNNSSMMQNVQYMINNTHTTSNRSVDRTNLADMTSQFQQNFNRTYNSSKQAMMQSQTDNRDYNTPMMLNPQSVKSSSPTMPSQYLDGRTHANMKHTSQQRYHPYSSSKQPEKLSSNLRNKGYNTSMMPVGQFGSNNATSSQPVQSTEMMRGAIRGADMKVWWTTNKVPIPCTTQDNRQ